jgi:hypothetical protein
METALEKKYGENDLDSLIIVLVVPMLYLH